MSDCLLFKHVIDISEHFLAWTSLPTRDTKWLCEREKFQVLFSTS
jgi:hypothetical protein